MPVRPERRPCAGRTGGPLRRAWVLAWAGAGALACLAPQSASTAATSAEAAAPPEARLRPGAALGSLPRFGVNLGGRSAWGAEQLMANILRNPGLEPLLDGALVVVGAVTPQGVADDTAWTARPAGFWAGAPFQVLSGPAAGQQGRVLHNERSAPGRPDQFTLAPMPAGLRPGDVLALRGQQDPEPAPLWWTEGRIDALPLPRPGSPGRQSLQLTPAPGQPAALYHHLDSIGDRAGKLLPVQGRWRLTLWLRAVQPGASLQARFGRHGRPAWLDQRLAPGTQWQAVSLPFDAVDDGPPGPLMLSLRADTGALLIDDITLAADAPGSDTLPGGFRAEVVQTLQALQPGYLRDWQGQLADSPANRSATALARQPVRYRPGRHEALATYGLPDFLALCAAVGARPWVVLPATTGADDARLLGQALAAGQARHRFDEIVVEFGNEHWNSVFRPAGIQQPAVLAEVADRAFAALREGAGPAMPLHRLIGSQQVNPGLSAQLARASRHSEGLAVAPYLLHRQTADESPEAALDRALHEAITPLPATLAQARALGRSVDVYEVNFHTTAGSASPAQRAAVLDSPGAGASLMRRLLQAAALGVQRQAVYSLAGFDSHLDAGAGSPAGASTGASAGTPGARQPALVPLFGITRDLAGPAHWRPTGRALAALNQVADGTAHAAQCDGAACSEITALAFGDRQRWAVVSSAPQPVLLAWPCQRAQRLHSSHAAPTRLACDQGQARWLLPARAWLTAVPQASEPGPRPP